MTFIASSAAEINEHLARDGFAVVDLLDQVDVGRLRDTERTFAEPCRSGFDSTILSPDLAFRAAVDRAVIAVLAPRLGELAPDRRIAFCALTIKRSGRVDGEVPMHQDWSFVDEARYTSVGVWCPLVDVDLDNGCLQVVKGSHALEHPPRAAFSPFLYPELVEQLRAQYLTSVQMRAGQAMLFDNRLFHCSPPNRGAEDRAAATAVLVPRDARLRYYHRPSRKEPYLVEVFDVADSFYLSHIGPGRPRDAVSLGVIDIRTPTATPALPDAH